MEAARGRMPLCRGVYTNQDTVHSQRAFIQKALASSEIISATSLVGSITAVDH